MKTSSVLITGARGFLGRHIAARYKKLGYIVAGVGHDSSQFEGESSLDRWVESDITLESLRRIKQTFDIIIHCAGSGSVGFSMEDPHEDFQRNVPSTSAVLEYIRQSKQRPRLLFISSAAVYDAKNSRRITEADDLQPVSFYGLHKKMSEELCHFYSRWHGMPITIIRFFSLYGPGLTKQLLWDACKKLSEDTKDVSFRGTGEEKRDWLYVDDAIRLIVNLSERPGGTGVETYNGASGQSHTVREMVTRVADELGIRKRIVFNSGKSPGYPAAYLADVTMALQTGWKPLVPLNEGIQKYVQWFKSYHST